MRTFACQKLISACRSAFKELPLKFHTIFQQFPYNFQQLHSIVRLVSRQYAPDPPALPAPLMAWQLCKIKRRNTPKSLFLCFLVLFLELPHPATAQLCELRCRMYVGAHGITKHQPTPSRCRRAGCIRLCTFFFPVSIFLVLLWAMCYPPKRVAKVILFGLRANENCGVLVLKWALMNHHRFIQQRNHSAGSPLHRRPRKSIKCVEFDSFCVSGSLTRSPFLRHLTACVSTRPHSVIPSPLRPSVSLRACTAYVPLPMYVRRRTTILNFQLVLLLLPLPHKRQKREQTTEKKGRLPFLSAASQRVQGRTFAGAVSAACVASTMLW